MMESSLRNRLPWTVVLCTILIMILVPVSSAAEASAGLGEVGVRSDHLQLRRRTTATTLSIETVVINGNEHSAHADGGSVEEDNFPSSVAAKLEVVVASVPSHRTLRTDADSISLEEAEILEEQSYPKANAVSDKEYVTTSSSSSVHRRTQDIEDILNEMSTKDPSEWTAIEWFIMILFLSFLGWLGCCLLTICCCGGCDTSNLLGWLCCWEICCRGGSDFDRCCDYALA